MRYFNCVCSTIICQRTKVQTPAPPNATLLTYRGHHDHVNAVAWSPNGQYIASGSADKTVQIWDATSGQLAFTYNGHKDAVNAVSWSTNNRLIAYSRFVFGNSPSDNNGDLYCYITA